MWYSDYEYIWTNFLNHSLFSSRGSTTSGGFFDIAHKRQTVTELEVQMNESDFWSDSKRAGEVSKRASTLKRDIGRWEKLHSDTANALEIAKEDQADQGVNMLSELKPLASRIEKELEHLELLVFLDGPYDSRNAIVTIYAGSGGTEALDWAQMLERMLIKFTASQEFSIRTIDRTVGEAVGIKNVTIEVTGEFAYGWLKGENGVHRLVRISPFDAEQMRHTTFAMIEVLPEMEEVDDIDIDPKDLRIDTFLSGGHGGQSVQTTYSAVRVVHIPTGITVSCQNERSQLQNREIALKILKARLLQKRREQATSERDAIRGELVSAEWGNQIRSYVLQPYKLVKDHRTDHESKEPDRVLEGELLPFEEAYLKWIKNKA